MSKTKLQTSMEVLEAAFKSGTFDPAFCLDVMTRATVSEKIAKDAKKKIQAMLTSHFESTVAGLYKEKASDTGTVSQYVGNGDDMTHELFVEKKKKVEWDQETLQVLITAFHPASKFIEKKYNVPEKEYAKMNNNLKEAIDPARDVKPGSPTFTIKERKDK